MEILVTAQANDLWTVRIRGDGIDIVARDYVGYAPALKAADRLVTAFFLSEGN